MCPVQPAVGLRLGGPPPCAWPLTGICCSHNPFTLPPAATRTPRPQTWAALDPRATNLIPATQLGFLVSELDPPLGVRGEEGARAKLQSIIMGVDIPVHKGGKVRA